MIPLTEKQLQESQVYEALLSGLMTNDQAAKMLQRSVRQIQRRKKAYCEQGVGSLIHKNTGRRPSNRVSEPVRTQIAHLLTHELNDYNFTHAVEVLESDFNIHLSKSTLRRIAPENNILSPQKKKRGKR